MSLHSSPMSQTFIGEDDMKQNGGATLLTYPL
jgi:hypothetical protein